MNRRALFSFLAAAVGASSWIVAQAQEPRHSVPQNEAAFTSTRQINALHATPDGELWAATAGGVLRLDKSGSWHRYTRLDGLPSHEALSFIPSATEPGRIVVRFPTAQAGFSDNTWTIVKALPDPKLTLIEARGGLETQPAHSAPFRNVPGDLARVTWQGRTWVATTRGLAHLEGNRRFELGMPPGSLGTHPSALCPLEDRILVAVYGDSVYAWNGKTWRKELDRVPAAAAEITALVRSGDCLWLGTRRQGIWEYNRGAWTQHLQPQEPYDHNVQALGIYRGDLYASTLEDGLMVRSNSGWSRLGVPLLSSNAPRHLQPFHGSLYVRHGTGQVDRLERNRWTTNVFSTLPRKQVFALASDAERLFAAQWGGWSEFNGREWTHFLDLSELQGRPITALQPDGDTLWIGTQGRGLAEVDRTTRTVRWHDEHSGLTDDWITALHRHAGSLYAGTFVGGLLKFDGKSWTSIKQLTGQNVTALASTDDRTLLVTTRGGLWQLRDSKVERFNDRDGFLDPEMQAVLPVNGGVWAGARTGLFFLKSPD